MRMNRLGKLMAKRMTKKICGFVLSGCVFWLAEAAAAEEVFEEIYYHVNNDVITKLDFDEVYATTRKDPSLSQLNDQALSNTVMSNLITGKVVAYYASNEGIYVRPQDIESEINRLMEANNIENLAQFNAMLDAQGLSRAAFDKQLQRTLLIRRYVERKVGGQPPTDEEIRAYYDKHKETQFKIVEPIYDMAWVYFNVDSRGSFSARKKVQRTAERVQQEVLAGKLSFLAAVAEYSDDQTSKANKGKLGWKKGNDLSLNDAAREELALLEIGAITPVYSTATGLFFYQILDRLAEGYIPFRLEANAIRIRLARERSQELFNDVITRLYKSSYIKENVALFDIEF